MEDIKETTQKLTNNGFLQHVFNFDNDTKTEVLNVGQYLLLAIIPMGFYNYMVDSVMTLISFLPVLTALSVHVEELPIVGSIP